MTSLPDVPDPWPYDPAEDAAERLADAMGDATHPMHEEHYEAEEEAFTRRHERENQAKPAPVDFDGPTRPDPVGPGQTLLRRLDAERQADHERGMERERVRYRRGLDDPRYG